MESLKYIIFAIRSAYILVLLLVGLNPFESASVDKHLTVRFQRSNLQFANCLFYINCTAK